MTSGETCPPCATTLVQRITQRGSCPACRVPLTRMPAYLDPRLSADSTGQRIGDRNCTLGSGGLLAVRPGRGAPELTPGGGGGERAGATVFLLRHAVSLCTSTPADEVLVYS